MVAYIQNISRGVIIKPVRILIVEKDEALAARITEALTDEGYKVAVAKDALGGLKNIYEAYPDLVIMARELPIVNGGDPYIRMRQLSYLPVIALGNQEEAAETLELGADAYMTKPLDINELVARVSSLLRRKRRNGPPGGSPVSKIRKHIDKGKLTPTELRLASCLVLNKGKLLEYRHLINEVWGGKALAIATLHFYIHRLQQKLANGNIFMIRGVGYCFSDT